MHHLEATDFNLRSLRGYTGPYRTFLIWASRFRLLRLIKTLRAFRELRGVEALIMPGTGILDDFGLDPGGVPLDLLIWCSLARIRRARVMFISVGAGPITNPRSLWLMRTAARMASHRSFRDEASREFMRAHRLDVSKDRVVPDIVFSLDPRDYAAPAHTRDADGLTVAIGVMDYHGWNAGKVHGKQAHEKHVADTADIVSGLLARGHRVKFIEGEPGDHFVVEEVLERVHKVDPISLQRCDMPSLAGFCDLFRELQACDVVIGTRFHNIVCSLMLGKPVISVGYAKKNSDLLKEFGLGHYVHHIETLSVPQLMEQFDELSSRHLALGESILRQAEIYKAQINEYLDELWSSLR
jgi:polysaccharide pyruvyl transferase WcaK-like protein